MDMEEFYKQSGHGQVLMLLDEYTDIDAYYWDGQRAVSAMAIWEDLCRAVHDYKFNLDDDFVDVLINKANIKTEEFIEYREHLLSVLKFSFIHWAKEQFKDYINELEELY